MSLRYGAMGAALTLAAGCSNGAGERDDAATSIGASTTIASTTVSGGSTTVGTTTTTGGGTQGGSGGGTGVLDVGNNASGCDAVDLLFVIDNSASMQTFQQGLRDAFPGFVTAMFAALPPGLSVHVGITTTDFDTGCAELESELNCQSTASAAEILSHYNRPTDGNDGGNGSQGRLFRFDNMQYFEISSDADPAPLTTWFSGAATAAGESGCSFEMPVAAAGWHGSPANDTTNMGFLRDERALLVIFFLTDEPDKSPEAVSVYKTLINDAKPNCGGDACVFTGGLIPACVPGVNQKLWQFMTAWGSDMPPFGDIQDVANYSNLVGQTLADAIGQACMDVPIP